MSASEHKHGYLRSDSSFENTRLDMLIECPESFELTGQRFTDAEPSRLPRLPRVTATSSMFLSFGSSHNQTRVAHGAAHSVIRRELELHCLERRSVKQVLSDEICSPIL